jgi:hypothetical protein
MKTTVNAVFVVNVQASNYNFLIQSAHYHRGYMAPLSIGNESIRVYAYFFYDVNDAHTFAENQLTQGFRVHSEIEDVVIETDDWQRAFRKQMVGVHSQHSVAL